MEQKTINVEKASNIANAIPGAKTAINATYGIGKTFKELGPKKTLLGAGAIVAGVGSTFIQPLIGAYGRAKAGRISYEQGPQRMTKPLNRGVIERIRSIAGDDPAAFTEMTRSTMSTSGNMFSRAFDDYGNVDAYTAAISKPNDYGVDSGFISSFYGMGG